MKRIVLLVALIALLAVIAACSPAPAPAPTAAPPTAAPASSSSSAAPAATKPAASSASSAAATGTIKGTLTLWHGYHTGGSEEQALNQLLDGIKKANPDLKLTVLAVPFDQLFNKYETEAAAGGGPDLWTAPNDNLGNEVRANLLKPIDDLLKGKLDKYSKLSIDGVTVDGKTYAVPMIVKAVALYYNKSKIPTPPKTTDDLLALVKSGKTIVLNENNYHNYGFFPAFGGTLMDAKGACVADQNTGFADAMQYLLNLKAAGAKFEPDGGKADTMFRQGQVDMIINGPWVLGDYKGDLKDNLGVVPMPAGPKGPSLPLSGIDGWYVNANTKNADAAVALGLALTTPEAQKLYADLAGDPAVRTDVTVADPLVKAFADAGAAGYPRPQSAAFGNWWGPFGDMVTKVIEGKATPKDGVAQACSDMNKANKITVAPAASSSSAAASSSAASSMASSAASSSASSAASSAASVSTQKVELRITWYNDGNEGDVLRPILDKFQAANPNITVKLDTVAYANLNTILQPQVEAGSPPDLARVTNLAQFQGYFLDLRPYLSNAATWEANWSPAFLGALRKPDDTTGLYGFPTQFTVSGPFINRTLFEQAGVPVPSDTSDKVTWQQWIDAAKKVATATKTPYAVSIDRSGHRLWGPSLDMCAHYVNGLNDTKFTVDSPGFRAAANMLVGWHKDKITPLDVWAGSGGTYAAGNTYFTNGQLVFYFSGNWQISQFDTAIGNKFKWDAVPNPYGDCGSTGMPGGAALVAFKATKNPKEVAKLVDYLTSDDVLAEFSAKALFLPGSLSLSKKGITYPTQNKAMNVFLKEVGKLTPESYYLQFNPLGQTLNPEMRDRLAQVITGELTLDDAIKKIQQKMDDTAAAMKK